MTGKEGFFYEKGQNQSLQQTMVCQEKQEKIVCVHISLNYADCTYYAFFIF